MTKQDDASRADRQVNAEGFLTSNGYLLARIGAESRRRWRQMLIDHDLGEHAFGVLMVLDQVGPQSQRELSRTLGIDPRNAVGVLDGLEHRSLVDRVQDSADRRQYAIRLTLKGRHLLERLRRDGAATESSMLSGLTVAERATLHRLLVKLLAAMAGQKAGRQVDKRSSAPRSRQRIVVPQNRP
jgi:DNA-binding MarR family transcriptional regulator